MVAHETLRVTQPKYNTRITVDSLLTYTQYAKYYEKFQGNADYEQFAQFYKQTLCLRIFKDRKSIRRKNEPIHQIRQLRRVVLAFYDDHFFHAQLLHRRSPICITSQRAVCSSTVPSAADDFNAASSPSSTLRMCSSWARE